jgi:hypothetical protein
VTRRDFVASAAGIAAIPSLAMPLLVPVHRVMDSRAKFQPEQLRRLSSSIWPEAVRDFERCGVHLQTSQKAGEVRRSPAGRPIFTGLDRGVINVDFTDHIPMHWDNGRALRGVTTRYEGYHLCMVALNYAHGHQIPFLSVNTCIHELLHVLLHDIFENRPSGLLGQAREFRIDWYATRLWLFHEGAVIRKAAQVYLDRLGRSPT